MDKKVDILLGSKSSQGGQNKDLFINVDLTRSVSEIKPTEYENTFDLAAEFNNERNTSRDFRIYGILDSNITDSDNLTINVFSTSGNTGLKNLITTLKSQPLLSYGVNASGKKRGKYLVNLSSYTNQYVYLEIPTDNHTYTNQIYSQQVIFYDPNGNFIPYGTQTVNVDLNGNLTVVNNDFYFLYNKHWIKLDLPITWSPPTSVSFINSSSPLTISANSQANIAFTVGLAQPSVFGLEKVDLNISTNSFPLSNIILTNSATTISSFPHTLSFAADEQYKVFNLQANTTNEQDLLEDIVFDLNNYINVVSGSPNVFVVDVVSITPKNAINFNFQNIFNNRNYFTGGQYKSSGFELSSPFYSVLRNGLYFGGDPIEFYPNDNFNLKITNLGINTIFPATPSLSVINDSVFLANQSLAFNINSNYISASTSTVKIEFQFSSSSLSSTTFNSFNDGLKINGIPIIGYNKTYSFDYSTIYSALIGNQKSGYIYLNGTLPEPYSISKGTTGYTLTLSSLNSGTRLDFEGYGIFSNIQNTGGFLSGIVTATTIQTYSATTQQIPFNLTLRANHNLNSNCYYGFEISKQGYKTLSFTSNTQNARVVPLTTFLVTAYNNILRNWDDTLGVPVYVSAGTSSNWTNYPIPMSHAYYNIGDAYCNGICLLANIYNDNTQNNSAFTVGTNSLNLTNYGNTSRSFVANFLTTPLDTIPQTSSLLSPQTSAQSGYLMLSDTLNPLPPNSVYQRSFDFYTGTSLNRNTYYGNWTDLINAFNADDLWTPFSTAVSTSGATVATNTSLQKLFNKLGIGGLVTPNVSFLVDCNAILRTIPANLSNSNQIIKIFSMTPGNGYVLNNIKDFRNRNGVSIFSVPYLQYIEIIPNEIFGITKNLANNYLGGYALTI